MINSELVFRESILGGERDACLLALELIGLGLRSSAN